MKLNHTVIVFDQGNVADSVGWREGYKGYSSVIATMVNPVDSVNFKIKKKRRTGSQWERNGVTPIKAQFLERMKTAGWKFESPFSLDKHIASVAERSPWLTYPEMTPLREALHSGVGNLDFWITSRKERIAIEWETGNISSSHRSLNKLCLALFAGLVDACVLIVPSRAFYDNLTDRVGNWKELGPYLAFWRQVGELGLKRGLLAITVVEHDQIDDTIGYITSGNDGRSAQGKGKLLLEKG